MNAADAVLKADKRHIGYIMLVGKNVCHDIRNTRSGIWNGNEYKKLFSRYHVKEEKRLHEVMKLNPLNFMELESRDFQGGIYE